MTNPESEPPLLPWEDDTPTYGFPPVQPSPPKPGHRFSRTHLALIIAASTVAICGGTVIALTTANNQPSQSAAQSTSPTPTSSNQLGAAATAPSPTGPALTTPPPTAGATTTPPISSPPTTTTPQPPPPPPNLCGAPPNPYGYNFCGGSPLADPASNICSYLDCVANFFNGKGFVVECQDNTFSKSGGTKAVCSKHVGYLQTLYQ
jgi:hypothetical protein